MKIEKQKEDNLAIGARGGIAAFVLQVITMGLGFINQIVLARILGAGGIGEVILALTILNVAALIAAFGMQGAMVRFVPYYSERGEAAKLKGIIYHSLKLCLFLSLIITVLVLFFSRFIANNIFHSPELSGLLLIVALALPVNVINDVIVGILKGHKDTFKALLPPSIISPFFRIAIFLLLSLQGISSLHAMTAFISGEVLAMFVALSFLLKKMTKDKPVYDRSEYKKVLDLSSTMFFSGVSAFLFTQSDLWIIGIFATTESVGIYGVVSRLVSLIGFSLGAFSAIIPPIMSAVYASGDRNELRRIVSESTRWSLSMAVPIILILVLEGKLILKYAYGEKFMDGYIALVILTIGQLINVGVGLTGWLLQMTGEHKAFMKINILGGILNVILNISLVPYFGIVGAAVASAFCLAMVNIVSVLVIYNKLSVVTLAKGLKFDAVFAVVIAAFCFLFNYKNYYLGIHFLLIAALIIYIWKSLISGDLPLKYLLAKYKTG